MTIIDKYIEIRHSNHKAVIKDKILKFLEESNSAEHISTIQYNVFPFDNNLISRGTNLHVSQFCHEMQQAGHVVCSDPHAFLQNVHAEYNVQITLGGCSFYYIEGGYTAQLKMEIRRDLWLWTKSIAAVINALAIIILTYKSYQVSDKSKSLEFEKDKALKLSDEYKKQADSLTVILRQKVKS